MTNGIDNLEAKLAASITYADVLRSGKIPESPAPVPVVAPSASLTLSVEAARFMPVMSVKSALDRRQMIVSAIENLLIEGIDGDYGVIPGTKKKTLLQPGAQKLDNLFGLIAKFSAEEKVLDWTGEHHGEPFFYFEMRCQLWRGEFLMGEGLGSCSSWESKYRYRTADRACPACKKEYIRKSKEAGWYCWKKLGGCGATFADGNESIEKQETGKKANPEICDVVNTVMKIAIKRSHVAATINATSASEFFTQDLEAAPEPKPEPKPATTAAQVKPWATFNGMLDEFAKVESLLPRDAVDEIYAHHHVKKAADFRTGPTPNMKENAEIALRCHQQMLQAAAHYQSLCADQGDINADE